MKAIKKVFSDTKHIKMNATKSLIGHCLGAAAGVEAVAALKAIETGWVHPTLNQHNLIDEVAGIDTVPNEKKQHKVGKREGEGPRERRRVIIVVAERCSWSKSKLRINVLPLKHSCAALHAV